MEYDKRQAMRESISSPFDGELLPAGDIDSDQQQEAIACAGVTSHNVTSRGMRHPA
jgi:hypothetical protein